MEEVNKPNLVVVVLRLIGDLIALEVLTKYKVPPRRKLRVQRHSVAYLMGDTRILGFGSLLWGKGRMIFIQENSLRCIRGGHQIFGKEII